MSVKDELLKRERPESQDYQNLKRDIEMLRQDLAKLSSGVMSNARSRAEHVQERASRQSDRAARQVESKVSERPITSLLISMVLGMLVAKAIETTFRR